MQDKAPRKYWCYLLVSSCSKRTYIGATVDLHRRLKQHNGIYKGGAQATKAHRPWKLALCVDGFETWNEALSFEWRWKRYYVLRLRRYRTSRGFVERERRVRQLVDQNPNLHVLQVSSPEIDDSQHHFSCPQLSVTLQNPPEFI